MTTLDEQQIDGVRVLRISGSLTQQGVDQIGPAFEAAVPDGARAVVDLGDVDLITTPGLTLFVSATQRMRNTQGRVVFTAAKGIVLDLIKRCRLDAVLEIEDDSGQAVERAKT
jgi:anti-anti-sigma factor